MDARICSQVVANPQPTFTAILKHVQDTQVVHKVVFSKESRFLPPLIVARSELIAALNVIHWKSLTEVKRFKIKSIIDCSLTDIWILLKINKFKTLLYNFLCVSMNFVRKKERVAVKLSAWCKWKVISLEFKIVLILLF